jgi:hypothetical protein
LQNNELQICEYKSPTPQDQTHIRDYIAENIEPLVDATTVDDMLEKLLRDKSILSKEEFEELVQLSIKR